MKMNGLSDKEIRVISFLELNRKSFFTRGDIKKFFKNQNEMTVYIHRLKKKRRIIKINQKKYYLIPVKAYGGHWSEHPFIIIDEIFDGKNYFIGGVAAAHYWGLIEQIPSKIEAYNTKKQGVKKIFNFTILFRRIRSNSMKNFTKKFIKNHQFLIANKKKVKLWMKLRK